MLYNTSFSREILFVFYCLYCFFANLRHSPSWLIVVSLSPHYLCWQFCRVWYILNLIFLILKALFCAAIRRHSVSLLRFPFLNHVHVFSCGMSYVSRLSYYYYYYYYYYYLLLEFIIIIIIIWVFTNFSYQL